MNPMDGQQWLEVKNNNASQVPAFGCMRVTGISVVETGRVVMTVDQPNTYGDVGTCLINSPAPISSGAYGVGTRSAILTALYDGSTGTPSYGQMWGPRSSSWKLNKDYGGFMALGVTNSSQTLGLFIPVPMTTVRGKPIGSIPAHSSNQSNPVNIYVGDPGSETQPAGNPQLLSVYNYTNCGINAGKLITMQWIPDDFTTGWWQVLVGDTS